MTYKWEIYDKSKHWSIDLWNNQHPEINQYALYNDTLSDINQWYLKNPNDPISNYMNRIFVVSLNDDIIAFVISNVSIIKNSTQANINPIVVHPQHLNQGHAKKIIKELISNRNLLLTSSISEFMVMVHSKNLNSLKLFEGIGFKKTGSSDDYIELKYNTGRDMKQ